MDVLATTIFSVLSNKFICGSDVVCLFLMLLVSDISCLLVCLSLQLCVLTILIRAANQSVVVIMSWYVFCCACTRLHTSVHALGNERNVTSLVGFDLRRH